MQLGMLPFFANVRDGTPGGCPVSQLEGQKF